MSIIHKIDQLQDEIDEARIDLLRAMKQRDDERQKFAENQFEYAERQNLCLRKFQRMRHYPRMAIPLQYVQALKNLSSVSDCPYVIRLEADLCRALHHMELKFVQLQLLMKYHNSMVDSLRKNMAYEAKLIDEREEALFQSIKMTSSFVISRIIYNRAKLEVQNQEILWLRANAGSSRSLGSGFSQLIRKRNQKLGEIRRVRSERKMIDIMSQFSKLEPARAA